MAKVELTVTIDDLSDFKAEEAEHIVRKFLTEKYTEQDVEVEVTDMELDEDPGDEEE